MTTTEERMQDIQRSIADLIADLWIDQQQSKLYQRDDEYYLEAVIDELENAEEYVGRAIIFEQRR